MTCTELHEYLASDPGTAINRAHDSAEISEHIANCPECNRLIEEQEELAMGLALLRDCAPEIPGSLDASVLAKYRTYLSDQSKQPRSAVVVSLGNHIRLRGAFSWVAAVTLAVIVAYGTIFLLIPHQGSTAGWTPTERRPVVSAPSVLNTKTGIHTRRQPVRKRPQSIAAAAEDGDAATSATQVANSFPTRFRSLMYCDQLSCPGAMDVIRVQLPSPVLGVSSISSKVNGVVSADVLVGPDGIARAIRVVE
jgi:hypothetical protein